MEIPVTKEGLKIFIKEVEKEIKKMDKIRQEAQGFLDAMEKRK